jgi:uncharacterized membrane protein SpoIIM required for sporulation
LKTDLKWTKAWLLGLIIGGILFFIKGQWIVERMGISLIGKEVGFIEIFLKNLLASLTTIYLGLAVCYLELRVYTGVSEKTYAFMERLTEPLYKLLGKLHGTFAELQPFYRSCLFYLSFVPNLSLFINGFVFGFLLISQPRILLPHGIIEVPAILASAKIAFDIKDDMEVPVRRADLDLLKERMRGSVGRERLIAVALVQSLVLMAAYVEVNYAF